ncbi:MAG: peptidoglycan-binding protein [Planctomycetota bacterium]|nr:MAG: peptidoglycan-binding protein [Planctomycetota bacterium]
MFVLYPLLFAAASLLVHRMAAGPRATARGAQKAVVVGALGGLGLGTAAVLLGWGARAAFVSLAPGPLAVRVASVLPIAEYAAVVEGERDESAASPEVLEPPTASRTGRSNEGLRSGKRVRIGSRRRTGAGGSLRRPCRTASPWPPHRSEGRVLRRGDRGPAVAIFKRQLFRSGYLTKLAPLGRFDADTEAALRAFERDTFGRSDGVATAEDLAALRWRLGLPRRVVEEELQREGRLGLRDRLSYARRWAR